MADLIEDILADFGDGVNSDPPPLKLARTQLSFATNTTVRGQYARPRPPYNQIQISSAFDVAKSGVLQAAAYYKPDAATEHLMIAVSGDLWKIAVDGTATLVSDNDCRQTPTVQQHWMWQAEKWLIWNDGIKLPVFYDGNTCRRSAGLNPNADTTSVTGYSGNITAVNGGPSASLRGTGYDSPPPSFTVTLDTPYTGGVDSLIYFTVTETTGFGLAYGAWSQGPWTQTYLMYFRVLSVSGNDITVRANLSRWPNQAVTGLSDSYIEKFYQWQYTISSPNAVTQVFPPYSGTLTEALTIPNPTIAGAPFTLKITGTYANGVDRYVLVGGPATNYIFKVTAVTSGTEIDVESYNVVLPNPTSGSSAIILPIGTTVTTITPEIAPELPAGKMGAYGMGRNVMALADGKRFIISDIVGGSSGSLPHDYRDAVLHITENAYLAGGGLFTIPGGVGDIRAIKFTATLDTSLGQGPCQIFTPTHVFSVNVPVDRTIWAELTNPILTQTLITNGGLSQNGTINANGDLIFRSVDGIRSLILARRDFATWGNVPMSTEMDRVLAEDQAILLAFCSAIVFDNRLLMTAGPHASDQGVYHDKLIALNFDPVSSLRGKAPSVYDGVWDGIDVLQLVEGMFTGEQRAFAFARNAETEAIELYELMPSNTAMIYDNGEDRIQWSFETAAIFKEGYYSRHDLLRLIDGEINVDQLEGRVNWSIYLRPDSYPCWVLWREWDQCAQTGKAPLPLPENADTLQVQFRPRMGLGEPSQSNCDPSTNRPLREGYYFQIKFVITGQCRVLGGRYRAARIPQPKFAPPICCT